MLTQANHHITFNLFSFIKDSKMFFSQLWISLLYYNKKFKKMMCNSGEWKGY